jgi:hypothetical protein
MRIRQPSTPTSRVGSINGWRAWTHISTRECVTGIVGSLTARWMPDYRRYRVPSGTYFFTVNVLERRVDTLVRHIDLLREAVRGVRQRYPFHIEAWVVLPDHLYCLWTLP